MQINIRSNFDMLRAYEEQLWRLGALAERYFADDPNTSLLKLRQFSELLAQSLAARTGLYTNAAETQCDLIRRLHGEVALPKEVRQVRSSAMSAIKLFCLYGGTAIELKGSACVLEKSLQTQNARASVNSPRSRKSKEISHA